MAENTGEITLNSEVIQSTQELVREVQGKITEVYGLKDIPDAGSTIWMKGDYAIAKLGQDPNVPMVFNFLGEESPRKHIYFPSPMMEKLAHSTLESRLKGDCLPEMAALIEETSHFIYAEFYKGKFGQDPHVANDEIVAVLDKYNILQALFVENFGRIMNPGEEEQAARYAISASTAPASQTVNAKAVHIIGHELGGQYISYLNQMLHVFPQGIKVSKELRRFYGESNQEQIRHLLYDLRFNIQTITPEEALDVEKVFQELGVPINFRDNKPHPDRT